MTATPTTVAVVTARYARDLVLKRLLEQAYPDAVSLLLSQTSANVPAIAAFIRTHQPRLVVFDLAPLYDESWLIYQQVRALDPGPARQYLVTVQHPDAVTPELQRDGLLAVEHDIPALVRLLQHVRDLLNRPPAGP